MSTNGHRHMHMHTHVRAHTRLPCTHKCRRSGVCLSSCVFVKGNHWQERTCMGFCVYVDEKTHTHAPTHAHKQHMCLSYCKCTAHRNNIINNKTFSSLPKHTHTDQLEERVLKPEETHLTSVQGHSAQTQTSRRALGSQRGGV